MIKESREVITLAFKLIEWYRAAMLDGQINLQDLIRQEMLSIIQLTPEAIEGLGKIPQELADARDSEIHELVDDVIESGEFDFKDEDKKRAIAAFAKAALLIVAGSVRLKNVAVVPVSTSKSSLIAKIAKERKLAKAA